MSKLPGTIRIDGYSKAGVIIAEAHYEVHDGHAFTAYFTNTTAATSGHRSGIYIKTPNTTKLLHMVFSAATSAGATTTICEAPTIAANVGTHTGLIRNRYRDSTNTSAAVNNATSPAAGYFTTLNETQIAGDATWATGTVLRTEPLTTGSGPFATGGAMQDEQEFILKANTAYVLLLTNTSATATTHWLLLDWYEQDPNES